MKPRTQKTTQQQLSDLGFLLDIGQFYDNERGDPCFHIETSARIGERMEELRNSIPLGIFLIQAGPTTYQIQVVGGALQITALTTPGQRLVIEPSKANELTLRTI